MSSFFCASVSNFKSNLFISGLISFFIFLYGKNEIQYRWSVWWLLIYFAFHMNISLSKVFYSIYKYIELDQQQAKYLYMFSPDYFFIWILLSVWWIMNDYLLCTKTKAAILFKSFGEIVVFLSQSINSYHYVMVSCFRKHRYWIVLFITCTRAFPGICRLFLPAEYSNDVNAIVFLFLILSITIYF